MIARRCPLGPWLVWLLVCILAGPAQGRAGQSRETFKALGSWLDSCEDSALSGAGEEKIVRALKVMASSNKALKTMDGAAHGLYAYSKARTDVREWNRIDYSRATTTEKEERLKALRKAKLLEEAMYSSELAELTAEGITLETALTYTKEMQGEPQVMAQDFAGVEQGTFRYMLLADHANKRLVLSVGDTVGLRERLDALRTEAVPVPLRARGLVQRSVMLNPLVWGAAKAVATQVRDNLSAAREANPSYELHVVGFSLGGGAAAVLAGLLDGTINAEDPQLAACVGMARGNVTAVVFGPPPCLSKAAAGLRRFVTSFVLGDDMVPRATPKSIRKLEKRLVEFVPAGGAGSALGLDYARGWVKGVVGSTLRQVVSHQVSRLESGAAEDDDEDALTVPGRVYYIKPRKVHGGATIKEVLVGNLREDVLWRLHEVFVSGSMLAHHSLDYHVRTLNRIPL